MPTRARLGLDALAQHQIAELGQADLAPRDTLAEIRPPTGVAVLNGLLELAETEAHSDGVAGKISGAGGEVQRGGHVADV